MKILHLCLLISFACFLTQTGIAEELERPPNVILILADDMAVGDLSCLNGGVSRTPNLDKLKTESVWFKRAYSASAVCAPARAALLTGRYPHRTGVVTLNQIKYPALTNLKTDEVTLGNLFQQNGYRTGLIGKWHCGMKPESHPFFFFFLRGFDEFQGFINHLDVQSYFDYQLDINGQSQKIDDQYLTNDLGARAIDFIRRHQGRPFFLHLAHYAPHRPIEAPGERITPYLEKGLSKEVATVYAMVEIMDETIGKLLAELDRLELSSNTIILFASDNGPDPLVEERFNHKLRGTKYMVSEGGIRVPFMIRWKNHFAPAEVDDIIHFTDVLPTLVETCQLKSASKLPLDGVSVGPVLEGRKRNVTRPQYWQWNRGEPRYSHNAAIRDSDWKLVRPFVTRNLPKAKSDLQPKLYNLSTDPGERDDVSHSHPELARRLLNQLEAWSSSVEQSRLRP